MTDTSDTIAGFGFCTDEVRPDLSGLDDQLARIEASGASHCELSLYELDLIVGGRVLPERRRLLERDLRAPRAQVHRARRAHGQLHGRGAPGPAQGGVPGDAGAVRRGRRERDGASSGQGAGDARGAARAAARARARGAARDGRRRGRLRRQDRGREPVRRDARPYTPDPVRLAAEIARDRPSARVRHCSTSATPTSMARFRGTALPRDARGAFAPAVNHLHVLLRLGRPTSLGGFYRFAERMAFGMGDLHLPIGWGDIPFDDHPARPARCGPAP